MKYASIVPLIGGETIAMENVFGQRPEYIMSYSDFQANDSQLLHYYNHEVPYLLLDQGGQALGKVDVCRPATNPRMLHEPLPYLVVREFGERGERESVSRSLSQQS